jgi:hypothetical protein
VDSGGQASECGWCKDRWGVSWQITPRALTAALARPGSRSGPTRFRSDDDHAEDQHRGDRGGTIGLDNAAIARQLKKSEKTVRHQVSSNFDKLGVHTRAGAIVLVRDRGG